MRHLEELCAATAGSGVGARVVTVSPLTAAVDFTNSVDRRAWIPRKRGTVSIALLFDGNQYLFGLYDSGANVTTMTNPLAKALGLRLLPYDGRMVMANGAEAKCAG